MSTLYITTWLSNDTFLKIAAKLSKEEGTALLFQAGREGCSFLFFFPFKQIVVPPSALGWEKLKKRCLTDPNGSSLPKWVGYLSYEMGCCSNQRTKIPGAIFYQSICLLVYDHQKEQGNLFISEEGKKHLTVAQQGVLEHLFIDEGVPNFFGQEKVFFLSSSDTFSSYCEKIAQIKEWILDGKVYQVNLSQQFLFQGKLDSFSFFSKLFFANPVRFSAFFKTSKFTILSLSPERFLKKKGDLLETCPIKGTVPRGKNPAEDRNNLATLLTSEKEIGELLMITDLSRNDLSKISIPGSVQVKELFRSETFANVHHLLSVVQSRSKLDLHPIDLIRNCFPGGSITGCPKLAAIDAIAALEKRDRNIYTGSIGYLAENGDFDFNIAIRTLLMIDDLIEIQLGGAITHDSSFLHEYEETLHKGAPFFKTLGIHGHCIFR